MYLEIRETILTYEGLFGNEMLYEAGNDFSFVKPHIRLCRVGR